MSENRSSFRFVVLGFAIVAISALSVVAETGWGGSIFGSIQEFLGVASALSYAAGATDRMVPGDPTADDAVAAPNISNGKILFTRSVSGIAKVFIVDPTSPGTETCLGMCTDALDSRDGQNPAWSPVGTTIAFTRLGEIWLMNADGSNQRRIAIGGVTGDSATFSSDGTKIAFTKICASCGNQFLKDIWMINADGTGPTQLTNATHTDSNPSWQPGGTTIAFNRNFANGAQIYTVTTGKTENQITTVVNANSRNARWSPDGTRLVFESDRDAGFGFRPDIYVMNAQGGNVQRITNDDFDDHNPTFSPDGTLIAWLSGSRPETSNNKIFVMNANGTNQHLVTSVIGSDGTSTPSWGPGSGSPTPTPTPTPLAATLTFDGKLRDRVSRHHGGPGLITDGDLDGTFTVTLPAGTEGKTLTSIDLCQKATPCAPLPADNNINRWDTIPADTALWVLGVDYFPEGSLLLNQQNDGSVSGVTVSNQRAFKLYISDAVPTALAVGNQFSVTVIFTDGLRATASATVESRTQADVGVVFSPRPPTTASPGDIVTFSSFVTNTGPDVAKGVVFTGTVDPNFDTITVTNGIGCSIAGNLVTCNIGDLAAGSAPIHVAYTARAKQAASTTNRVRVAIDPTKTIDNNSTNDSDSAVTSISGPQADLSAGFSPHPPASAVVNEIVTFSVPVTNYGPATAHGVQFNAFIDSGFATPFVSNAGGGTCSVAPGLVHCNMGDFALNVTKTITFTAKATQVGTSLISVLETPDSSTVDPKGANNGETAEISVGVPQSDLEFRFNPSSPPPTTLHMGQKPTYTILVNNNGPQKAFDVTVSGTVPPNTQFDSASSSSCTTNSAHTSFSCKVTSIDPGPAHATSGIGTYSFNLVLIILRPGSITLTANVDFDHTQSEDPFPSNNLPISTTTSFLADVQLRGLEVTQGVQDLNNDMPLVAGKTTFVRAHVNALTFGSDRVASTAFLTARNPSTGAVLGKIKNSNKNGGEITVHNDGIVSADRKTLDDSFYFQLLPDWTNAGPVEFTFAGNEFPFTCNEADAVKDCKVTVQFQTRRKFSIKFLMTTFIDANGRQIAPTDDDLIQAMEEIRASFPLADFDIKTAYSTWNTKQGYCTLSGITQVLNDLKAMRSRDCGWEMAFTGKCRADVEDFYLSLLPNPSDTPNLCSFTGPITTGIADTALDRDGIKTNNSGNNAVAMAGLANTRAHELGHNFGLKHTCYQKDSNGNFTEKNCGAVIPSDGTMSSSKDQYDPGTFYGFDTLRETIPGINGSGIYAVHNRIYDANTPDMMSYGNAAWPSAYNYKRLFNALNPNGGSSPNLEANGQLMHATADGLFSIDGTIQFSTDTGQFGNVYAFDGLGNVTLPPVGDYAIRFENSQGGQLTSYAFQVSPFSEGGAGGFSLQLPKDPATRRIVLLHNGQVLATRQASANPPTVTVTSPNGGETLSGATTNFTWTAADPDNNALSYTVEYSIDGGVNWTTLTTNWDVTSYPVDLTRLPASNQALIRVTASDGFNSALDQSNAVFIVPQHAPKAVISSPETNHVYVGDQTINLNGRALDIEDGLLDGSKLSWSSNLNGPLGTGSSLPINASTLIEGTHTITLTGTDSTNRTGSSTINIKVFRNRPVFPATLLAGSTGLTFNAKTSLQTVAIRNSGDGDLTWSATADQPWIKLSAASGTAPSNVDVTIIPGGLPFGNLTGKITFTSPEAANGPQVVNVNLAIIQGSTSNLDGRVVTPDGRGLRSAGVTITDSQGVIRSATTSSFGFFSFPDVAIGETYTVRIGSRSYRFAPRTMQVISDLTLPDFVGLE